MSDLDMTDIKRMRYFNGEFLNADDFNAEQDYYRYMRYKHNRDFHMWGIGDGLDVTLTLSQEPGQETKVTVGTGTAIDGEGREIILNNAQTIDFSESGYEAGKSYYVTISWRQEETGYVENQAKRWLEIPLLNTRAELPTQQSMELVLAKVTLKSSGRIIGTIDKAVRQYAAIEIGEGTITSSKIAVADGTSGQDTAVGAGIKRDHIQNEAVSEAKLAVAVSNRLVTNGNSHNHAGGDGAVINHSDLNLGADKNPHGTTHVEVNAIQNASQAVKNNHIAAKAVSEDKLADIVAGKLVNNGNSHNHAGGNGGTINHADLNLGSDKNPHGTTYAEVGAIRNAGSTVTTTHIADDAVTEDKLANTVVAKLNNIGTHTHTAAQVGAIANAGATVLATHLADGAVITSKIADDTVTEAKLANTIVTKLNSVGTHSHTAAQVGAIANSGGTVGNSHIAAGAVSEDKLAASVATKLNTVGTHSHTAAQVGAIANGTSTVGTGHIATGAVSEDKLAASVVSKLNNVGSHSHAYLSTSGGTINGNLHVAGNITYTGSLTKTGVTPPITTIVPITSTIEQPFTTYRTRSGVSEPALDSNLDQAAKFIGSRFVGGATGDQLINAYAEYYESVSGEEIKEGTSVVLDGEKVRAAKKNEKPMGVITKNPLMVGGNPPQWPQKYLKDDFGNIIMEEYKEEVLAPKMKTITLERPKKEKQSVIQEVTRTEVVLENGKYIQKEITEQVSEEIMVDVTREVDLYDKDGKTIIGKHQVPVMETYEKKVEEWDKDGKPIMVATGTFDIGKRPKLNPKFDQSKEYIPRSERPEWNCVGIVGKLSLRKGQPVSDTWRKIKDISKDVELWLVK